jgi:hypothetical protein
MIEQNGGCDCLKSVHQQESRFRLFRGRLEIRVIPVLLIGEAEGGCSGWLAPWSFWAPWAPEGLETAAKEAALKVGCVLDRPLSRRSDDVIASRLIKRASDDPVSDRDLKHWIVLRNG